MSEQANGCDEVIQLLRSTEEGVRLDEARRARDVVIRYSRRLRSSNLLAFTFNPAASVPRGTSSEKVTIYLQPGQPADILLEPLKKEIKEVLMLR